jgi:hypothetical protein
MSSIDTGLVARLRLLPDAVNAYVEAARQAISAHFVRGGKDI